MVYVVDFSLKFCVLLQCWLLTSGPPLYITMIGNHFLVFLLANFKSRSLFRNLLGDDKILASLDILKRLVDLKSTKEKRKIVAVIWASSQQGNRQGYTFRSTGQQESGQMGDDLLSPRTADNHIMV